MGSPSPAPVSSATPEQQVQLSGQAQLAAIQDHVAAQSDARKRERELSRAWLDKVVPSLRGTMDPTAVADLERRMALRTRGGAAATYSPLPPGAASATPPYSASEPPQYAAGQSASRPSRKTTVHVGGMPFTVEKIKVGHTNAQQYR